MKYKRTEFERQQEEFSRGEQELRKAGYLFGDESRRVTSRIARMTPREVVEALEVLRGDRERSFLWFSGSDSKNFLETSTAPVDSAIGTG